MKSDTKICPYCGEKIKCNAIKCRYCGTRLDKVRASKYLKISGFLIIGIILISIVIVMIINVIESSSFNTVEANTKFKQVFECLDDMFSSNMNTDYCLPADLSNELSNDYQLGLKNGIIISILKEGKPYRGDVFSECTQFAPLKNKSVKTACAELLIDINGFEPPNKHGKDQFKVLMYNKSLETIPHSLEEKILKEK